jgi:hypothetical protein
MIAPANIPEPRARRLCVPPWQTMRWRVVGSIMPVAKFWAQILPNFKAPGEVARIGDRSWIIHMM